MATDKDGHRTGHVLIVTAVAITMTTCPCLRPSLLWPSRSILWPWLSALWPSLTWFVAVNVRDRLTDVPLRAVQAELTWVMSVRLFNRCHSCTDLSTERRTQELRASSILSHHSRQYTADQRWESNQTRKQKCFCPWHETERRSKSRVHDTETGTQGTIKTLERK